MDEVRNELRDELPAAVRAVLPAGWQVRMGPVPARRAWCYLLTDPSGKQHRWEEPAWARELNVAGAAAVDAACVRAAVALALAGSSQQERG